MNYDCIQVATLLSQNGFGNTYTDLILSKGVTGQDFMEMGDADLNSIGITFRPHRIRILKLISSFCNSSSEGCWRSPPTWISINSQEWIQPLLIDNEHGISTLTRNNRSV